MKKLSVRQVVGTKGDKEIIKTKTLSNIDQEASDENMKTLGDTISSLMLGNKKDIVKIETTSLL